MKRQLVVLLLAVVLFVVWFLFGPAPVNDPVTVRPGAVPASGAEKESVIGPSFAPRPKAPRKRAEEDSRADASSPKPARGEPEFPFLEKLTPETRARVMDSDCAGTIDALLTDLGHTPNDESLDKIASAMARLEKQLREKLAVIEGERTWDLSDPQQRLERFRRQQEAKSTLREERHESLRELLPPEVLDRLLDDGDESELDREP